MKNKLVRRKIWDRQGVSEVVATILTLTITVVLFSTIIAMVNTFPAPNENLYTEFSGELEWIDPMDGGGAYIRITNTGGMIMTGDWTRVVLSVDALTQNLHTKGTIGLQDYGLGPTVDGHKGPDNGDTNWDTGEVWAIRMYPADINENSDVGVMIADIQRNAVAWSATILGKNNQYGPLILDMWVDSNLATLRRDPVEFGMVFHFFATISDPDGDLDAATVYADLSSIDQTYNHIILQDSGNGTFRSDALDGPFEGTLPIGYHMAIVYADDTAGNHGSAAGRIAVGQDIGAQPNLVIHDSDLKVSDVNPTNGEDISVTVTVTNYGGACTGLLEFHDVVSNQSTLINNRSHSFTIADSPAQYKKTISFTVQGGGPHTINVSAYPVGVSDFNTDNNYNTVDINVMPTILLVDDDAHMADGSGSDTVSYMKASLDSCDFKYDLYIVNPGYNGPDYRFGEMALKKYDIVIWMCGYESSGTLTGTDQSNIEEFLNDADGGNVNGGSLWLIGQNIFEDSAVSGSFFTSVLKVDSVPGASTPGPTLLRGVAGNPISQDWNASASWIPVVQRVAGEGDGYVIEPNTATDNANITFLTSDSRADAINHEHNTTGARKTFFPWEFSRIETISDQTQVAFRVIMWLGNISAKFGRDLAVAEQTTEPTYVFVNQYVNVTATIRNNGVDVETGVKAILIVDGYPDRMYLADNLTIEGMGGRVTISALWKAEGIGTHVLKWMVDWENKIEETNENNNQVSSYVSTGEVYVKFRILVVDDDGSGNNNMGVPTAQHNETGYVTDSLERLGYEYEYNETVNSTCVVGIGEDGPSIDVVQDYSAVIWVTGSAGGGLTDADNTTLARYLLNNNGSLWLIGEDMNLAGTNLSELMGIQSITPNAGISGRLRGIDNSSITHGMNIPIINSAGADVLTPVNGAEGVFYQNYASGDYCSIMFDHGNYKGITFAHNISAFYGSAPGLISGNNAADEVAYMVLHWFEYPDTRKEARITMEDYMVSDSHPLIGGAYILRAKVHNVGSTGANLLVRFMDGSVQIGADSIAIEPDQTTSAEIIWRPLFAGNRTISVLVDPVGEAKEVFEWFNNNISFNIFVYFFWDDMESGGSKWTHASTIMNVNGEGPLDYYSSDAILYTNISTDWDWSLTVGVDNSTVTSKSYPNSFHMEEPPGALILSDADALVSFAIDDSRSMQDRFDNGVSWLDRAKDAAKVLLDQLSDDSVVVSIWDFNGNMERRWFGPDGHPMTSDRYKTQFVEPEVRLGDTYPGNIDGRQYIRDQITAMANPPGQTILWDAVGGAYEDVAFYSSLYPDLTPVVIVLSDGMDLQASDQSGLSINTADNKIEGGSAFWCPWGSLADGERFYNLHHGKYTLDWSDPGANTIWLEALAQGSMDHDRYGLLDLDIMTFTIGLGLEHHDDLATTDVVEVWEPEINAWPGNHIYDYVNAVCDDPTVPTLETGTLEYNLWRVANTSGAEYFYAPDASDLEIIFTEIGQIIATGGINQTKAGITPQPMQTANYDKCAVTESFNLTNLESAKLCFWQKYNIAAGAHGGFLQVGYKDTSVGGVNDWEWRYIIPANAYTGNLKFDEYITDSFGTRIFWCWNGLSGGGQYKWEKISVDILNFIPSAYRDEVRVKFNYTQFGGGTGIGWFLDSVRLSVSRPDALTPVNTTQDIWTLTDAMAHSGSNSWSNVDPGTGQMKDGIDNYLMTSPIDLTNAKNAYLSAYFKFNFNEDSGAPPDGFRIEVTGDGGASWTPMNLGVRSSWGVSGTGLDNEDGNASDGKAYTGLCDSGNPAADGYWVHSSSLSRVNADLSAWMGRQILIRFRVVTSNHQDYEHDNNHNVANPGFGGFYVDDVIVHGETIFG